MKPFGRGERRVLVVGEAPGETEDVEGIQFVGKVGSYLRDMLDRVAGVELHQDCWTTNALICRSSGNKITSEMMIDHCRPNLVDTVEHLEPDVILLLGFAAVKSLIGGVWNDNPGPISRWAGWRIPSQKPNAWICPTYHPSYILKRHDEVLEATFLQHLHEAFELRGRPWDKVPNYEQQVEVLFDVVEAARILREMARRGGRVAFDYEANCLKPEYPGAQILCASACWEGKKTIAYPWQGEAIEATKELLHADNCYFIASMLKFENRWTNWAFGRGVRHWLHDTVIGAHVLDNRRHISGLKFQAYIYLGMPAYDEVIREFMQSQEGSKLNLLKEEVELRQLLLYCGTDTLMEFLVADKQIMQLGKS